MFDQLTRRQILGQAASTALAATGAAGLAITAHAADPPASPGRLRKAVLWSMLPGKMPIADRFKLAADVGFEGVEAQTTDDEKIVAEMLDGASKAHIPIHSVMNMGHWQNPLSSDQPELVRRSLEALRVSIRNAKTWSADTVLLVPAVVNADTRYQDAYTRSHEVIREELLPTAREAGVTIAIENVWNKFLLSPLEFARYVDEFKDDHLTAYFDIGNIVQYGFPEDWILTLGPRIRKIHLKDFKRSTNKFVPLREGDVNWPVVRKAIDKIGYRGFLTTELSGGDESYLREVVRRIDLILEGK